MANCNDREDLLPVRAGSTAASLIEDLEDSQGASEARTEGELILGGMRGLPMQESIFLPKSRTTLLFKYEIFPP
jgi:hypothetical protein